MEQLDHATDTAVQTDQAVPVQSGEDTAPDTTAGQTPGGTPDTHPEEYTPEQIAQWREAFENKSAWQKSSTQRDQELAYMRRQFDAERQSWLNDPTTRQLMQAREIMQKDPSLAVELERYVATQGKAQGPLDPFTQNIAINLRKTQDQLRAIQYEKEQADRQRVEDATLAHVEAFREKHPDKFGDGMDEAFNEFYDRAMRETDVADLEDAFLLLYRDEVIARAREAARTESDAVEGEKLEAASGIQPGAPDDEAFQGFRRDFNFRETRQRAMQHDTNDYEE